MVSFACFLAILHQVFPPCSSVKNLNSCWISTYPKFPSPLPLCASPKTQPTTTHRFALEEGPNCFHTSTHQVWVMSGKRWCFWRAHGLRYPSFTDAHLSCLTFRNSWANLLPAGSLSRRIPAAAADSNGRTNELRARSGDRSSCCRMKVQYFDSYLDSSSSFY